MSQQEPSASELRALGTLVREMQGDLRALGIKLDLLARGRERDLATFGTRDGMHDIVQSIPSEDIRHYNGEVLTFTDSVTWPSAFIPDPTGHSA
jgi:hypothetical protein